MTVSATAGDIFRRLDRPIWIVTSAFGDRRGGLVATFVTQSSLSTEPAVIQLGLAPNHFTTYLIDGSGTFVAHLLSATQAELALGFCLHSGRDVDKFDGIGVCVRSQAAPRLQNCLAWMDCRVVARLEGGDRVYFWGEVTEAGLNNERKLLCESDLFSVASEDELAILRKDREQDIELQTPMYFSWRDRLPTHLRPLSDEES